MSWCKSTKISTYTDKVSHPFADNHNIRMEPPILLAPEENDGNGKGSAGGGTRAAAPTRWLPPPAAVVLLEMLEWESQAMMKSTTISGGAAANFCCGGRKRSSKTSDPDEFHSSLNVKGSAGMRWWCLGRPPPNFQFSLNVHQSGFWWHVITPDGQ